MRVDRKKLSFLCYLRQGEGGDQDDLKEGRIGSSIWFCSTLAERQGWVKNFCRPEICSGKSLGLYFCFGKVSFVALELVHLESWAMWSWACSLLNVAM